MNSFRAPLVAGALLAALTVIAVKAMAQHVTGAPGSPGSTMTINGKQLPPEPLPFGGVIQEKASEPGVTTGPSAKGS